MNLIMGIDPGFKGAVAVLEPISRALKGIWDIPTKYSELEERTVFDLPALSSLIESQATQIKYAFIEKVSAMPSQGVVSMFRFGEGYGMLQGLLAGALIPTFHSPSSVWKSAMGLTKDKNISRRKAAELFPDYANSFELKSHDGRAEAALLAYFASRLNDIY
ncbi:hypothetical protein E6Q11_02440 [Candidatus Dojkabacteria bacterium]|uniref:Uncharacterized protein n=1 Tax=Candidatus Dojkabacteria bacterium TaxID=2099670 RepID=A0A5C7J832_9BACT|nr:MAG: hypothetical protein E6Q11_02440 [Candidatus Dojkabacteria bacterium]